MGCAGSVYCRGLIYQAHGKHLINQTLTGVIVPGRCPHLPRPSNLFSPQGVRHPGSLTTPFNYWLYTGFDRVAASQGCCPTRLGLFRTRHNICPFRTIYFHSAYRRSMIARAHSVDRKRSRIQMFFCSERIRLDHLARRVARRKLAPAQRYCSSECALPLSLSPCLQWFSGEKLSAS